MDYRAKNLDGLRGLAILMVVVFHFNLSFLSILPPSHFFHDTINITQYGASGVNLFFLISGFVISNSLEKNHDLIFLKKRWLRLFPSMLAVTIIILIFSYNMELENKFVHNTSLINIFAGILFFDPLILRNIFNIDATSLSIVFWSIYVEVKFYLIIYILYRYFKDNSRHWIGILYLSYLVFKYLNIYFPDEKIFAFLIEQARNLSFSYFSWFATGIYFFYYIRNNSKFDLFLCVFFGILSSIHAGRLHEVSTIIYTYSIICIFMFSFKINFLNKIFSNNFFIFFGFISYPLYLLHDGFVYIFLKRFQIIFDNKYHYLNISLSIIALIIITYLISVFIEKKFYKLNLKLL